MNDLFHFQAKRLPVLLSRMSPFHHTFSFEPKVISYYENGKKAHPRGVCQSDKDTPLHSFHFQKIKNLCFWKWHLAYTISKQYTKYNEAVSRNSCKHNHYKWPCCVVVPGGSTFIWCNKMDSLQSQVNYPFLYLNAIILACLWVNYPLRLGLF